MAREEGRRGSAAGGEGSARPGDRAGAGGAPPLVPAAGKDGPQLVKPRAHRWTPGIEDIFLDRLAASNNATWAAKEVGFSKVAIYARARRDPGFAQRMAAARAQGYARVDELLARSAEDFLAGTPDPESPIPPMTVSDAIAILKLHRAEQTGEGRRPAWPARRRSLAEVHESILKKLSAIARKRGLL